MIAFLLTSWWLYVPIIIVLVLLTRRNNQKIASIMQAHDPQSVQTKSKRKASRAPKKQSAQLKKVSGKLGLTGAAKHLRR